MSPEGPVPARPTTVPPATVLRGLDVVTAGRSAREVLAAVAWNGPVLDPDTTPAGDFLSRL